MGLFMARIQYVQDEDFVPKLYSTLPFVVTPLAPAPCCLLLKYCVKSCRTWCIDSATDLPHTGSSFAFSHILKKSSRFCLNSGSHSLWKFSLDIGSIISRQILMRISL